MSKKNARLAEVPFFEYTVADGETIFDVARRFGTTMNILARLNRSADPLALQSGQVLKILKLPPGCETYSVKPADTLREISARFHVPERCIRAYNCLGPSERPYPGLQLMIPGGRK